MSFQAVSLASILSDQFNDVLVPEILHNAVEAIFSITEKSHIYVRPRMVVWAFYA